jgi:hypothetical protein
VQGAGSRLLLLLLLLLQAGAPLQAAANEGPTCGSDAHSGCGLAQPAWNTDLWAGE